MDATKYWNTDLFGTRQRVLHNIENQRSMERVKRGHCAGFLPSSDKTFFISLFALDHASPTRTVSRWSRVNGVVVSFDRYHIRTVLWKTWMISILFAFAFESYLPMPGSFGAICIWLNGYFIILRIGFFRHSRCFEYTRTFYLRLYGIPFLYYICIFYPRVLWELVTHLMILFLNFIALWASPVLLGRCNARNCYINALPFFFRSQEGKFVQEHWTSFGVNWLCKYYSKYKLCTTLWWSAITDLAYRWRTVDYDMCK